MTAVPPESEASSHRPDTAGWLVMGLIATTGLYLAYVHAPLRLKLPIIAPVALGALTGWGWGRWGIARQVRSPPLVVGVAVAFVLLGQIGIAAETFRLGVKPIRLELNRIRLERDPFADEIERALAGASDDEDERVRLQREHEDARRRRAKEIERFERQATFLGYLEQRIPLAWGKWPFPWPELFWGGEVIMATIVGGWLARGVHGAGTRFVLTNAPREATAPPDKSDPVR